MNLNQQALADLSMQIKRWGKEFGFAEIRIADVDLSHAEAELQQWLDAGYHGEMAYMASHGTKRSRPDELVPGTVRVISARMNYCLRLNNGVKRKKTCSRYRSYFSVRAWARLSQSITNQAATARRQNQSGGRRIWLSGVYRFSTGNGSGAGREIWPWLAR